MSTIVLHRGALLFAASGAGKSSLINAGVVPAAQLEGYQPERLRVQPKPGMEIVVERIAATADPAPAFLPSIFSEGDEQPRIVLSIADFVRCVRECASAARPLLIFDQFEEWITLFHATAETDSREGIERSQLSIADAITDLLNDPKLPVKILIALREDYVANLAPLFKVAPYLPDHSLRLVPLKPEQVFDVIRGPYEAYGVHYRPEIDVSLATRIREEFEKRAVAGQVQLSEVQIVCQSLFEGGSDVHKTFDDAGGVKGLLERFLERMMDRLPAAKRDVATGLLARLITSSGTRNVVSEDALVRIVELEDQVPRDQIREALHTLETDAHLVRCEPRRGVNYYEITSEFLIDWIRKRAAEREKAIEVRKLRATLEREHRERGMRRQVAGLAFIAVVTLTSAIIAFGQYKRATGSRWDAEAHSLAAQSLLETGEVSGLLAAHAFSLHAERGSGDDSWEIASALHASLRHNPRTVLGGANEVSSISVAGSPALLALVADGRLYLWDITRNDWADTARTSPARQQFVTAALSRDASWLAAGTDSGHVLIWSLPFRQGEPDATLRFGGATYALAFSPAGDKLAAGDREGIVQLWALDRNRPMVTGPRFGVGTLIRSLHFGRDGRSLAVGTLGGGVELWLVDSTARKARSLPGIAAAISEDGEWIATGDDPGRVRVWKAEDLREPAQVLGLHGSIVLSLAFSPDGTMLSSAGVDGTVRVWGLQDRRAGTVVRGHEGVVPTVQFAPDGRSVLSAGLDGSVKQLALAGRDLFPLPIHRFQGHVAYASLVPDLTRTAVILSTSDGAVRGVERVLGRRGELVVYDFLGDSALQLAGIPHEKVMTAALSSNGRYVAYGGADTHVWLKRLEGSTNSTTTLLGNTDWVRSLAFSRDSQLLVSGGDDGHVRVWNVERPDEPAEAYAGAHGWIYTVAISPDGRAVAAAGQDWTVSVWMRNAERDTAIELRGHADLIGALAFSRDGARLASASHDGTVRVWALAKPETPLMVVRVPGVRFTTLSFGRQADSLAGGGDDGKVRVWTLDEDAAQTDAAQIMEFRTDAGAIRAVAFAESGDSVYAIADSGAIYKWPLSPDKLAALVCERTGRNMTHDEWSRFVGWKESHPKSCASFGTHPSWITAARQALREGHRARAEAYVEQLNRLDGTRTYSFDAEELLQRAREHATRGNADSAIALTRRAIALLPQGERFRSEGLAEVMKGFAPRAQAMIVRGQADSALALVSIALTRSPLDSAADSTKNALRSAAARAIVSRGDSLLDAEDIPVALAMYSRAESVLGAEAIPAVDWNNLCWYGSLHERPRDAMFACEHAVRFAPTDGNIRDSRGLARALTGDRAGAIEDFTFYIRSAAGAADDGGRRRRQRWVRALTRGQNPFTDAELRELREM